MTRIYVTLEDLLLLTSSALGPFALKSNPSSKPWEDIFKNLYSSFTESMINANMTYANKVLTDYIYPEYWSEYIYYTDNEYDLNNIADETALRNEARKNLFGSLWVWLQSTTEKYNVLIGNYEAKKATLMAEVSNTNESIFQNTPQSSLSVYDATHTSTRTVITNKTDAGTPIQRLREIENGITMLYKEWCASFAEQFIIWSGRA